MVRRIGGRPGTRALGTAASANTSLLLIAAMRRRRRGGVRHDLVRAPRAGTARARRSGRTAHESRRRRRPGQRRVHGFCQGRWRVRLRAGCVLRPPSAAQRGGAESRRCLRHVWTRRQTSSSVKASATNQPLEMRDVMVNVMQKNLAIIGNCIGLTADIEAALADYESGVFRTRVDSVYSGHDVGTFLDRTYNATSRFGKVVFRYST